MLEQIFRATQEIENIFERNQALTYIVKACAQTGQYDQADAIAQAIDNPHKKVEALTGIALAYSNAGLQEKALEILDSALEVIQISSNFLDNRTYALDFHEHSFCLIVVTYVAIGQYQKAMQVVENYLYLTQPDFPPTIKDELFLNPSKCSSLLKLAHRDDFQQLAGEIQVADSDITRSHQTRALASIACECAKIGQLENAFQAIEAAHSIGFPKLSRTTVVLLQTLSQIAVKYAELGQLEKAYQTIAKMDNPKWEANTEGLIAQKFAEVGQYLQAYRLIKNIKYVNERSIAFSALAIKLAQVGQYEQAEALIKTIKRLEEKHAALLALAEEYVKVGQCDLALETAGLIKDIDLRDSVVLKIVEKYVETQQEELVFQMVKKTKRNSFKSDLLITIAQGLTKRVNHWEVEEILTQLLQLSKSVHNRDADKNSVLVNIAQQYFRIGQNDKGDKVLDKAVLEVLEIENPIAKAYALADIGIKYIESGQETKASTVLSQALQIVESDELSARENALYKPYTLEGIASKLIQVGEYERALEIINRIEISEEFSTRKNEATMRKCIALIDIAEQYVKINQKEKAMEIFSKILQVPCLDDSYKAAYIGTVAKLYLVGERL